MEKKPMTKKQVENKYEFVFGKLNYILMIAGVIVLLIGYILLSGGGSDDPNVFNPAMFDVRRLYVAPILIVVGFIIEIVAIMYRGGKKDNAQEE